MYRKGFSSLIRRKPVLASFWNLEGTSYCRQEQKVIVNLKKCLHPACRNLHIGFLNEGTFFIALIGDFKQQVVGFHFIL